MTYVNDKTIYRMLKIAHVIKSQYDLSALCGRSPGWFSSTRCQGRDMSPSALLVLTWRLQQKADQQSHSLTRETLIILSSRIHQEAMCRAQMRSALIHENEQHMLTTHSD